MDRCRRDTEAICNNDE
ncbi:hypothetical protein A2U01_0118093, partial [Trifolium medium]|nr:hypothetical protein [Trifolium medium]